MIFFFVIYLKFIPYSILMKIYDIIVVWWWAAGLFTTIKAKKDLSKLILEKNKTMWIKVLLSWWERANVSNMDIEPTRDYFWQNRKAMISIYNSFTNWDLMWWFSDNWINIVEEDRWRLILESWDSRELLDVLVRESKKNNTEHLLKAWVLDIKKDWEIFEILTEKWTFYSKNVVISSWWRSFMHTWTVWDSYRFLENFGHEIAWPHRWLSWLVLREDLSEISWVSSVVDMSITSEGQKKSIYTETWPILFTHFWVSWPIIHNAWVAIWEFLNSKKIFSDEQREEFLKENLKMELHFSIDNSTKSMKKFFDLKEDNLEFSFWVLWWRSWKEAKVTWGWIYLDELTNTLESKKIPWLYVAWEALDITWKTGWFNLQLAWSSWNVIWKAIY